MAVVLRPIRQRNAWCFDSERRVAPTDQSESKQDWHSPQSAGSLLNRRQWRAEDSWGVGLGFLLFTNQDARQITADLLRTTGDAIAPADEDRTLEDRINEVLVGD